MTDDAANMREWIQSTCEQVLHSCRRVAVDGTILFTPDGEGHYGALWTRDFAYLVQTGGHLLERGEMQSAIRLLLDAVRRDGAAHDVVLRDARAPAVHRVLRRRDGASR